LANAYYTYYLCDQSDAEHLVARPASKFPPNGVRRQVAQPIEYSEFAVV